MTDTNVQLTSYFLWITGSGTIADWIILTSNVGILEWIMNRVLKARKLNYERG